MKEKALFPEFAKRKKKNGFNAWRTKELAKWNAVDFYGYFLSELQKRERTIVLPREAVMRHFRQLIDRFTEVFGEKGKEALKDLIDQCVLDRRCVGTGFLLRQAEGFVAAQGWKYRKPEHEEL